MLLVRRYLRHHPRGWTLDFNHTPPKQPENQKQHSINASPYAPIFKMSFAAIINNCARWGAHVHRVHSPPTNLGRRGTTEACIKLHFAIVDQPTVTQQPASHSSLHRMAVCICHWSPRFVVHRPKSRRWVAPMRSERSYSEVWEAGSSVPTCLQGCYCCCCWEQCFSVSRFRSGWVYGVCTWGRNFI